MKNQNKGITLIALVITIIILLILAGITINSLTGNGLFENTKLAKEKSENAQKLENETLGEYENEINSTLITQRDDIKPIPLWTNENPNSSISGQTIAIDLSEYKYAMVIIKTWTEEEYYPRTVTLLPVSDNSNPIRVGATSTSRLRYMNAKTSGIIISDEITQGNNDEIIPMYIYGIKSDLGIWDKIMENK